MQGWMGKTLKNVTNVGIAEWQKVKKQGRDDNASDGLVHCMLSGKCCCFVRKPS